MGHGIVKVVLQHEETGSGKAPSTWEPITDTAGAVARARRAAIHGAAEETDRQARELEHLLDSQTGSGCGEAPG